jgi:adenine/guanine phosphoribosyltransferase-like PRPP-binding protein
VSDNEQPSDALLTTSIDLAKGLNKSIFSWVDQFDPSKGYVYSVEDFLKDADAAFLFAPTTAKTAAEPPKYIPPPDGLPVQTAPAHTKSVFDISTLPLLVRWAEDLVYQLKADAIVACGHSGLVLAGAVSYATRVPVVAVRKAGEPVVAGGGFANRVSANLVRPAERWVWLDDFLSTGGTFKNAVKELKAEKVVAVEVPVALLSYSASKEDIVRWPTGGSKTGFHDVTIPEYGFRE